MSDDVPDGNTLSYKMLKMNGPRSPWRDRRLKCEKCNLVMDDGEPMAKNGSFWHKENGCENGGRYFHWTLGDGDDVRVHGIVRLAPKKYGRARKRGARRAKKHRGGSP